MKYKHLNHIERCQISSLMKANQTITQIAQLSERYKHTIIREVPQNAFFRGYRPKQACELALKRSESSRNACTIASSVKQQVKRSSSCNGALSRQQESCF
jgi:IS30 family transposase